LLIVSESRLSAAWTPGIEVSAVGRPDEPLARYDELQLEFSGGTVPAKTRAVYTETGELAK